MFDERGMVPTWPLPGMIFSIPVPARLSSYVPYTHKLLIPLGTFYSISPTGDVWMLSSPELGGRILKCANPRDWIHVEAGGLDVKTEAFDT